MQRLWSTKFPCHVARRTIYSRVAPSTFHLSEKVQNSIRLLHEEDPEVHTIAFIAKKLELSETDVKNVLTPPKSDTSPFTPPPIPDLPMKPHLKLSSASATQGFRRYKFLFTEVGKQVNQKNRKIFVRDIDDTLRPPTLDEYKYAMKFHDSYQTRLDRRILHEKHIEKLVKQNSPIVMHSHDDTGARRPMWREEGLSRPILVSPETAKGIASANKQIEKEIRKQSSQ